MIRINVNIDQGYPFIFIKDMLSNPYNPDDSYDGISVFKGVNHIYISCQPVYEDINTVFLSINDAGKKFAGDIKYEGSYRVGVPSGVLMMQDDATVMEMADNTYMALKCDKYYADIEVFLDDFTNPKIIGLKIFTGGAA